MQNYNIINEVSEWVVIINLREKSKEKTRALILNNTRELLYEYGLNRLTSKKIAEKCSLSHGTIFLHFARKDLLIDTLLESNIDSLTALLKKDCDTNKKPLVFINKLLSIISLYEDLLSFLYKDEYYLSATIKSALDKYENNLKNLILDNYRIHSKKRVSIIDTFVMIDAFLSQLRFYLVKKEYSVHHVSLVKQRKGRIVKLYNLLFTYE